MDGQNQYRGSATVICLKSLKNKEIETININLMDRSEQEFLANSLYKENYKINMVNLTNLPDYDADALLIPFCEGLPMNPDKGLFVLNVHDRGVKNAYDRYDHALFHTTSINGLKKIYNETIPDTFAKYDKRQHGENIPNPATIRKNFLGTSQKTRYDSTYKQYEGKESIKQIFSDSNSVFISDIEYENKRTLNRSLDRFLIDNSKKGNYNLREPMLKAMNLASKHNIKLSNSMLKAMDLLLNYKNNIVVADLPKNDSLTLSELQVLDIAANHFRKHIVNKDLLDKYLLNSKPDEFLLEQYISNRKSEGTFTNNWCYLFGLDKHEKSVKVNASKKMLEVIRKKENIAGFTADEIKAIEQKGSNLNKVFKALTDDNQIKIGSIGVPGSYCTST